jgi:hypothetical protein
MGGRPRLRDVRGCPVLDQQDPTGPEHSGSLGHDSGQIRNVVDQSPLEHDVGPAVQETRGRGIPEPERDTGQVTVAAPGLVEDRGGWSRRP